MKTWVKIHAALLIGIVANFNIYAQDADNFLTPYEIEQGQYKGSSEYYSDALDHTGA